MLTAHGNKVREMASTKFSVYMKFWFRGGSVAASCSSDRNLHLKHFIIFVLHLQSFNSWKH